MLIISNSDIYSHLTRLSCNNKCTEYNNIYGINAQRIINFLFTDYKLLEDPHRILLDITSINRQWKCWCPRTSLSKWKKAMKEQTIAYPFVLFIYCISFTFLFPFKLIWLLQPIVILNRTFTTSICLIFIVSSFKRYFHIFSQLLLLLFF